MYSDAIVKALEKGKISTGDHVKVTSSKENFEGVLMPRPDTGDESILVLKLGNGYNIGIKFDKNTKIEKSGEPKTKRQDMKQEIAMDKSLPKVTLITTGGTISSSIDYETGGVQAAGVHMLAKPGDLLYETPELRKIANIHVNNLLSMMSEDMTYKEWQRIAKSVAEELNSGAHGVVVMHGTDTMHYTAAALSFMLKDLTGPVVVTGAQRSSDRGSSDAFMNIICSTNFAAKSEIAEVGICMHADSSDDHCNFMRGTKVRKMHTSRRDAFRAINIMSLAQVYMDGRIDINKSEAHSKVSSKKTTAMTDFEPNVALIKVYPDSDPAILEYYAKKGCKGVIIEGTGLGHTPMAWVEPIKKAVDSGMIVGMTSQTIYGRVNDRVYSALRRIKDAGAIYCEDMLPETAYVKLGFLLGNHKKEEAAELLPKNLVGEITKRTDTETNYFE